MAFAAGQRGGAAACGVLAVMIAEIFEAEDGTYGYRRMAAELARRGVAAGAELVRKLMSAAGARGLPAQAVAADDRAGAVRADPGPGRPGLLRWCAGREDGR